MQGTGEAVSLDSARLTKLEKQNWLFGLLLAFNFAAVLGALHHGVVRAECSRNR